MIPLLKPSYTQKEIDAISETMRSGWIGLGPKVAEFEKRFADFVGAKYAVATDSCTNALIMALDAYGIRNKRVAVPALTFVSTALAPLRLGNEIVFGDIDEETLCMKPVEGVDVSIPVHYGGRTAVGLYEGLVIEDCAHAAGNKTVGKNTSCWSFHAVKNLATGDGGMVTTNDEAIKDKLLALRWCGIDKSTWDRSVKKYGWDYDVKMQGYKGHMNDLAASIGLVQLERLEEMNNKRKLRVLQYLYELQNISWLKLPKWDADSSWHLFVVRLEERDRFIDHLLAHGISAGVHYKPLNQYPIFPNTPLPTTDRVWKTLVTLPLFPDMTDEEFSSIVKTIKEYKGV